MAHTANGANPVLVEVTRGKRIENIHRGSFVICSPAGNVLVSTGDIKKRVFPRSAIKVIQAIPLVESGAASTFEFTDKELALACASHNGEKVHVHGVQAMLEKAGVKETDLACGDQWPLHRKSAGELARSGQKPASIHNTCSGKHAGMLAFMKHAGQGLTGYVMPERAIQRRISVVMEELVGEPFDVQDCAMDGCSVPTWAASLKGWAQAFARLATGRGLSSERFAAARRLMEACFNEPYLVGGENQATTYLLEVLKGEAFVKNGADGVYCAALPELELGIALKIDDGDSRAADVLIANLLAFLIPEKEKQLTKYLKQELKNKAGHIVGERRASTIALDTMQMFHMK